MDSQVQSEEVTEEVPVVEEEIVVPSPSPETVVEEEELVTEPTPVVEPPAPTETVVFEFEAPTTSVVEEEVVTEPVVEVVIPAPAPLIDRPGNVVVTSTAEFEEFRVELEEAEGEVSSLEAQLEQVKVSLANAISYRDGIKGEITVVMEEIRDASTKYLADNS